MIKQKYSRKLQFNYNVYAIIFLEIIGYAYIYIYMYV